MSDQPTWCPLFRDDYKFTTPFNLFKFVRDSVVNKYESWDFFLSGDRGMGKSACAMSLAKMLDPNFTVSHWAFTSERFIELITTHHPPGTCIVFDDVGTAEGSSSRKWNSEGAHTLSDVMQINRTDSLITIGTSLQLSRMELRLREGFRVLCQPIKKLTAKQTGSGMAIDVEMRLRTADVFDDSVRYKLWRYCPGGRIKYVRLFHPPAPIWREYQLTRREFLEHLKAKRAEKAAALTELREKKAENAEKKALKATDKEWAHEIHVNPMNLVMYRNVLKAVGTDGSKDLMKKPELIQVIAATTMTKPATSEAKIRKLVTAGVLTQLGTYGLDGKKSFEYEVSDKGLAMIDKIAIPLGD
jgi:hypothetical protein